MFSPNSVKSGYYLRKLKVKELSEILKDRGLSTNGNEDDLVEMKKEDFANNVRVIGNMTE